MFIQHIYYHFYSKWNKLYYFSVVAIELHQIRAYEEEKKMVGSIFEGGDMRIILVGVSRWIQP